MANTSQLVAKGWLSMKRPRQFLLLISLILCSAASIAEIGDAEESFKAVTESIQESLRAKQLVQEPPEYPRQELRRGREAWVHVTYCIDETGSVQNASVLDSIGNNAFDEAALQTVQKWAFEPALQNGTPAWQSRNEVYINFALQPERLGASRRFIKQFRKISKLIEAEDIDAADELFWETYNTYDLSLYELGKLWAQRVRIDAMQGDLYKLNMALTRATASHGSWIEKDSYVRLLGIQTQVRVQLGKYHEAMHSFNELIDEAGDDDEAVAKLQPTIDNLRSLINGDKILRIPAQVRARGDCTYCNDSWDFIPVRNDFQIVSIQGTLNSIDMRCDHKRIEMNVSDEVQWHIPEKWGTCHIQLYGEPGTTFDVLMLPTNES